MNSKLFWSSLFLCVVALLPGCGGGSSGTALGGSGDSTRFSGIVLSADGRGLADASVSVQDTGDIAITDEAGAFDLNASFVNGLATLEIETDQGQAASVVVQDAASSPNRVDLSILFNQQRSTAALLDVTMRARMVRNCGALFLNTRTIKQTAPVLEGLICTIEVEFKKNGIPLDEQVFELQHRGCGVDEAWQFSGLSRTGGSGPGTGEIDFAFRNDERHCVYRVIGPRGSVDTVPVTTQIDTLRKQAFDRN